MWPRPKSLCGAHVSLLPLSHKHSSALASAAKAPDHMPAGCRVPQDYDMGGEISFALEQQADAKSLSFAAQRPNGDLIGMVKYAGIDRAHKRLEIGDLWLADPTSCEITEIYLMLLSYGFEFAQAQTIQLRARASHAEHRALIMAHGGQLDGVLRGAVISRAGKPLNVAVYSILASEWAEIRTGLQLKLRTE